MAFDWQALVPEELEKHFNPRLATEDSEGDLRRLSEQATAARGYLDGLYDAPYGPGPKERFDVFRPSGENLPAVLFIHGGYWRALDKSDHSHLAKPCVDNGIAHLSLNYELCPTVTLDTIVDQMCRAVAHIYADATELGLDQDRLYLSGHSAGAHLVAMLLAQDWRRHGLPAEPFRGALALSGIFDPRPVLQLKVNAEIGLNLEIAQRNNALGLPLRCLCPQIVAVGALEPEGWRAQSEDYAEHACAAGAQVTFLEVPDRQHFTVLDALADGKNKLCQIFLEMVEK